MKGSKSNKKTVTGVVVSSKMDKTVTVQLEVRKMHPIYKKFVKSHTKLKAHDPKNEVSKGDVVKVIECRPVSKDKTWRVIEILEKA